MKEFSLIFALVIGALVAYAARSYQRAVMALEKAEQLQELAKREIAITPSAATDPAANTSAVEQSAADVSLPQPEVPPSQAEPDGAAVLPPNAVALLKPAPVYRVARPAPTRQYSSCGPGGCAPSGPIRRFFGRR